VGKVVAIIKTLGTLLNLLFDTKFEILDTTQGRGQTTKGIWMAKNNDNSILVFDIEGTDSKERGEQRLVPYYIITACRLSSRRLPCLP